MLRRSSLLLLSLFAYLWTATCLGETLLIHQLSEHHDEPTVSVPADGGRELVFHHAGHQDEHEPTAADSHTHDHDAVSLEDDGHHGDHVVTLGCEQLASPALGKDFKVGKTLLALPTATFIVSLNEQWPVRTLTYPRPTTRNALSEFVRTQRLLI